MNLADDTKKNVQGLNRCFGSLFPSKLAVVAHFADIIGEVTDVNVPGTYKYTASKKESETSKKGTNHNVSGISSVSCKNATMKNEFVAKSFTNDHEKKPGEKPVKKNQLVENAEANTLKNDRPHASNQRQSSIPATDGDEALTKQEIENVEMSMPMANDNQLILRKSTRIFKKRNLEFNTQPLANLCKQEAEEGTIKKKNRGTKGTKILSTYKIARKLGNTKKKAKKLRKCSHCSYASTRSDALQKHIREKPYKCNQCPFATARDASMRVHARIHSNHKPYKCFECSYASSQKAGLQIHMRTHTGEKPFKCTQCLYASTQKAILITHMRTHTGEKPFKCNKCSYVCAQTSNFKSHMYIHAEKKPFKCSQCSYVCCRKTDMQIHIRNHASEKPFWCSQCSFASARPDSLKEHMYTHSGDKPHKCKQCSFSGMRIKDLKNHIHRHHMS